MEPNSLPPASPEEEGHKQSVDHDVANKREADSEKHKPAPGGKTEGEPKSGVLAFVIGDGLLFSLFGGLSSFFWNHKAPILSAICFCLFLATIVAGFAAGAWKAWPDPKPTKCIFWVAAFALVGLIAVVIIYSCSTHETTELPGAAATPPPEDQYSGALEPSNEPLPPFPDGRTLSDYPSYSTFLFMGGDVVCFRHTLSPCVVAFGDECFLTLDEEYGKAFISGKFLDEDGNLVAELISNRFDVAHPPTTFKIFRPSKSILIVRDSKGEEVLNVEYLNDSAFRMTGILRGPNKLKVVITPAAVHSGGHNDWGNSWSLHDFGHEKIAIFEVRTNGYFHTVEDFGSGTWHSSE